MDRRLGISTLLLVVLVVLAMVAVVSANDIVVVINSPANTTYASGSIGINVTASAYGAIDKVIAEIDATTNVTLSRFLSTNYYNATQQIGDGRHVIRIYANDTVGASDSSQVVYFTVDTSPPTVTINSPMNTTYGYHGVRINVTVSDLSPISKVIAQIDGATNVTLTLSGGFYVNSATYFTWGSRSIQIFANDTLGYMNAAQTVWFTVVPSLEDYPYPFVNTLAALNMTIIVPSSGAHPPCGGAHTMDVMSAINIAVSLGQSSNSSVYTNYATMDDYVSVYNESNWQVSFTSLQDRNLIIMAGPGVSQETYYYNDLRDWVNGYLPNYYALPVTMTRYGNGTDYLAVWPSGHEYQIEYNGPTKAADYGVVQSYYDKTLNRYVLLAYGLGGDGTFAAAQVLANYKDYNLSGQAVIVKYYDSNADGYLDTISIVETVP